ncbi:MAG: RluA family pseudouridine synthase [Firmicutes bacterium]|nr:RluA family pseudouridine synthase [Bacillota bacterium]
MANPPPLRITINSAWKGRTIESILRHELRLSRKQIIALKKSNGVFIDGKSVLVKERLAGEGEELLIRIPLTTQDFAPENIPLTILYEDPDLIIIDKPAGLLVHPVRFHLTGTLANALTYHWQQTGEKASFHPVHRLDRLTSGLLLIAKSSWSHQQLSLQLREHEIRRTYLALTDGIPPRDSGVLSGPIKRAGVGMRRIVAADGQEALTHYRVLRRSTKAALLLLSLITGRTHQIRVHLSHLGTALIGDPLYGRPTDLLSRPALHATALRFRHPRSRQLLKFRSSLPPDLKALGKMLNLL